MYTWNLVAAGVGVTILVACSRDARLSGHNIRENVTAKPVTLFGQTLDERASPKQVAFAVLMAIREDFLAKDDVAREAALDKEFDLCAPDAITTKSQMVKSRDESIYQVVNHWTPTVSHYVHDFDTDWEKAKQRLIRVTSNPASGSNAAALDTRVEMEVNDPSGEPTARVVLIVYLTQENDLWRATHLGFASNRRSIRRSTGTN